MSTIGSWGDLVFTVSQDEINTFTGMKWDSSAKYATHVRHLKSPLLEFTGTDVESMSFALTFSVFLGVNPIKEVEKLQKALRAGEVHRLVLGSKPYGKHKWVLTKVSASLERHDNHGGLLHAKVNVSMSSYSAR